MTNVTINHVNMNILDLKKELDYIKDILENSKIPLNKNTYNLLMSEKSLAKDWLSKEEDRAWKNL